MEPDYTRLNSGELLTALGDDAAKWAAAFDQIVVRGGVQIDQGLMLGWFANAMMRSLDEARWRSEANK